MRSKTVHKKHKQRMYNMRGCSHSSSSCDKKSKKTHKKRSWKGGCGETCPMTNHSMIGGYLRTPSSRKRRARSSSRRSSSRSSRVSRSSRTDSEMRGGNVITDVLRGVAYNGGVVYNALEGYPPPVSPAPYANQFRSTFSKI